MDAERQRAIAVLGGIAAHKKGTAHQWTAQEAQDAGRLGGLRSGATRKRNAEAKRATQATTDGAAPEPRTD